MTPSSLLTSSGKRLSIGSEIGRGGEGAVYEVVGFPKLVAKIYTDGRAIDRRPKVQAMISKGLYKHHKLISFPVNVLLDDAQSFVGFTMRKIGGARPIHYLWNKRDRQENFSKASVFFIVRVACNAARAVAQLHESHCVIGDINESGFLVTEQGTVALIDSDSFQYYFNGKVFPSLVGTPDYRPPEHQGVNQRSLRSLTPNHDNFGLAVIIFKLLMLGTHPFMGKWEGQGDPPLHERIKYFRYAYGHYSPRLKVGPQPMAPPIEWLPPYIRNAFERSFGKITCDQRPCAREWVTILNNLEKDLVRCEQTKFHYFTNSVETCPWCKLEARRNEILFGESEPFLQPEPPKKSRKPSISAPHKIFSSNSSNFLNTNFLGKLPAPLKRLGNALRKAITFFLQIIDIARDITSGALDLIMMIVITLDKFKFVILAVFWILATYWLYSLP